MDHSLDYFINTLGGYDRVEPYTIRLTRLFRQKLEYLATLHDEVAIEFYSDITDNGPIVTFNISIKNEWMVVFVYS